MLAQLIGTFRSNRIRQFHPQNVTARSDNEVPSQEVGLHPNDVEAIWRAVETYYRVGLQPAIALCIRRNGKIILNRTIGHSHGNAPTPNQPPLQQARPTTLFNLFSASKCITSMLIHLLAERRQLCLDDPVCRFIPKFGCKGKEKITIRHLLTHRAGIPHTPAGGACLEKLRHPQQRIEALCDLELHSEPGRYQAYHALNSGSLLGEIIKRISGANARDFLRSEITQPLGFKQFSYGVSPELIPQVASEAFTGPRASGIPKRILRRSLGIDMQEIVKLANEPAFLTSIVPSANIISTAEETTLFFELLLRQGSLFGKQIFAPSTIRNAVAEERQFAMDRVMCMPVRFGRGFMLGGELMSLFGPRTPRAFGHLGFTNVIAYADPQRDITVALLNNGKPFIALELVLWLRIMWVIGQRIPRDYGGTRNPGPRWQRL